MSVGLQKIPHANGHHCDGRQSHARRRGADGRSDSSPNRAPTDLVDLAAIEDAVRTILSKRWGKTPIVPDFYDTAWPRGADVRRDVFGTQH